MGCPTMDGKRWGLVSTETQPKIKHVLANLPHTPQTTFQFNRTFLSLPGFKVKTEFMMIRFDLYFLQFCKNINQMKLILTSFKRGLLHVEVKGFYV